jgi:hypothetical protein
VRRRWPATLVSWSRLLAGRFRDPLVGRDVLAGSRTKYQDFLTLWKDADPDIPIVKAAKAEYAKSQ